MHVLVTCVNGPIYFQVNLLILRNFLRNKIEMFDLSHRKSDEHTKNSALTILNK